MIPMRLSLTPWLIGAAASLALLGPLSSLAATPTTVSVRVTETKVTVSPNGASPGRIAFAIRNAGIRAHVVFVDGHATKPIRPGATVRLVVSVAKAGKVSLTSTTPGEATKHVTAVLTVAAVPNSDVGLGVFVQAGCGGCHSLKAAQAAGIIGPDFDVAKPSIARVVDRVTNGFKGMPPFLESLTTEEIAEVAEFVYESTH